LYAHSAILSISALNDSYANIKFERSVLHNVYSSRSKDTTFVSFLYDFVFRNESSLMTNDCFRNFQHCVIHSYTTYRFLAISIIVFFMCFLNTV